MIANGISCLRKGNMNQKDVFLCIFAFTISTSYPIKFLAFFFLFFFLF